MTPLQWGWLARILYKFFRPQLVELVDRTDNELDNTVVKIADSLVGRNDEQSK